MSALPVEAQKAKGPAALFLLDEEASSSSLASIILQTTGAAGRLTAYATVGTTGTATWGAGILTGGQWRTLPSPPWRRSPATSPTTGSIHR